MKPGPSYLNTQYGNMGVQGASGSMKGKDLLNGKYEIEGLLARVLLGLFTMVATPKPAKNRLKKCSKTKIQKPVALNPKISPPHKHPLNEDYFLTT